MCKYTQYTYRTYTYMYNIIVFMYVCAIYILLEEILDPTNIKHVKAHAKRLNISMKLGMKVAYIVD